MAKKKHGFAFGAFLGMGIGALTGLLLAPRSGEESRKMLAGAANDATDKALEAIDTVKGAYEQGARDINKSVQHVRPVLASRTDELRAKVELARARMEQMRTDLSSTIDSASSSVDAAVSHAVSHNNQKGANIRRAQAAVSAKKTQATKQKKAAQAKAAKRAKTAKKAAVKATKKTAAAAKRLAK